MTAVDELKQRAEFFGLVLVVVATGPYFDLSIPGDTRFISRGDLQNTYEGIEWFIDKLKRV